MVIVLGKTTMVVQKKKLKKKIDLFGPLGIKFIRLNFN